jgi:GTP:adenosylcobinamide-phosphate guanylyltransferase
VTGDRERTVVIPAHGLGTRIRELTGGRPKTMLELTGRPLLWRLLAAVGRVPGARAIVFVQPGDATVARFLETARPACPVEIRFRRPEGYIHDVLAFRREVGDEFSTLDSDLVVPPAELSRFLREGPGLRPDLDFVAGAVAAEPAGDARTIHLRSLGDGAAAVSAGEPASDLQLVGAYHWRPAALRQVERTVAAGSVSFHTFMTDMARSGRPIACLPFSSALNVNTAADLAAAQEVVAQWQARGWEE